MYSIEIKNLNKEYKKITVLNNITLNLKNKELFALLGTNGAGKTTMIKILSTLIMPTSGTVKILNYDLENDYKKIKSFINISPQEISVALNLTVKENLEFVAGIYKVSKKDEKIKQLIELFKLGDILNQKVKTLSGGWQRKLSIAMALINDPKILFLDEPTLGLDVISRKELWTIIKNLKKDRTVILTTHYMEEVEELADEVAIIDKGRLISIGTVESLKMQTKQKSLEDAFTYLVTKEVLK